MSCRGKQAFARYEIEMQTHREWEDIGQEERIAWECVAAEIAGTVVPAEAADNDKRMKQARRGT